jgi:hypothetical protein
MATYAVGGSQGTISSSYKGCVATWAISATPKRIKWYEIILGATGNPNATDTYFQFDVSRLSQTTSIAGTAFTPNPTDAADGAAVTVALISETTEPSAALIANSLLNFGLNQRNTTRWVAPQESQYLIAPATGLSGLYARALSNAYTGALASQITFLE